jgi:hypothetical protein
MNFHCVGNWNTLAEWLCAHDCFIKKGEPKKREETHLLLSGGRLCVRDELNEEFLREYLRAAFFNDVWLYVVEKKSAPTFRMLAELDLCVVDQELTREWLLENLVRPIFLSVTDELFPGTHHRISVAMADVKVTEEEDNPLAYDKSTPVVMFGILPPAAPSGLESIKMLYGEGYEEEEIPPSPAKVLRVLKYGIHLVWPELPVDAPTARIMRACFLHRIHENIKSAGPLSTLELAENWSAVLDPAVFDKNGLRMLMSRKAVLCPDCNGQSKQIVIEERKQRKRMRSASANTGFDYPPQQRGEDVVQRPAIEPCHTCHNVGKLDQGRPYNLVAFVSSRGAEADAADMELCQKDILEQMHVTSIRLAPPPPVESIPKPEIGYEMSKGMAPYMKTKRSQRRPPPVEHKEGKRPGTTAKGALVDVECDDEAFPVISRYMTEQMHCLVTKILTDSNRHIFFVNTTSRECRNKPNEPHKHSTIYYLIYPDCMYQKCWCQTGEVYKPGGCSCLEYRSSPIAYLPDWVPAMRKLFPKRFAMKLPPVSRAPLSIVNFCSQHRSDTADKDEEPVADSSSMQETLHCSSQSLLVFDPELDAATDFEAAERIITQRRAMSKQGKR